LANFDELPSWGDWQIFTNWNASGGTVSVSGGGITADQALTYLINKGLPDSWTPA
jgi:hypothetical protein